MSEFQRVELTDDELQQHAKRAGNLAREIELLEVRRKTEDKKNKKQIADHQRELGELLDALRTGCELRPVQVDMFEQKPVEMGEEF